MAILTKTQIHQFNRKMLGLGAPVVIDGVGYNKFDFGKMANFADRNPDEFTDRQCWFIVLTLGHYKNTQLQAHKLDIEESIAYYKPTNKPTNKPANKLIKVVGTNQDYVEVVWNYDPEVSAALRGSLDKSQYRWKKVKDTWILAIKWGYVDEICHAFADLRMDTSELYAAKPPVYQMSLFDE